MVVIFQLLCRRVLCVCVFFSYLLTFLLWHIHTHVYHHLHYTQRCCVLLLLLLLIQIIFYLTKKKADTYIHILLHLNIHSCSVGVEKVVRVFPFFRLILCSLIWNSCILCFLCRTHNQAVVVCQKFSLLTNDCYKQLIFWILKSFFSVLSKTWLQSNGKSFCINWDKFGNCWNVYIL